MKTNTTLLNSIGGCVGNSTPDPQDTDVMVPNIIVPSARLQEACTYGLSIGAAAGLGLAEQKSSHLIGYSATRAIAAGAITDRFLNLGSGLWRVQLTVTYLCPAAATQLQVYLQLSTVSGSGGGQAFLVNLSAPNNYIPNSVHTDFEIAIPKGYKLQGDCASDNTAGASILSIGIGGVASKLL